MKAEALTTPATKVFTAKEVYKLPEITEFLVAIQERGIDVDTLSDDLTIEDLRLMASKTN